MGESLLASIPCVVNQQQQQQLYFPLESTSDEMT